MPHMYSFRGERILQLSGCHQTKLVVNSEQSPSGKNFWNQTSLRATCLCVQEVSVITHRTFSHRLVSLPGSAGTISFLL
jgi:hypothetical protein